MKLHRAGLLIGMNLFLTAVAGTPAFGLNDMREIKKVISEQVPEKDTFEIELRVVSYTAENFKDPFQGIEIQDTTQSADSSTAPPPMINLPDLKVQGIIWGTKEPQAIINNQVVKVGGVVNDISIVDITGNEIIILYKNQKFTLPAPSGSIKTPNEKRKGGKK